MAVQKLLVEIRDAVSKLLVAITNIEQLYGDMHTVRDALLSIGDEIATLVAKIDKENEEREK